MSLKRVQECSIGSTYGMNFTTNAMEPFFPSSILSPFQFNSSQQTCSHYFTPRLHGFSQPYPPGNLHTFTSNSNKNRMDSVRNPGLLLGDQSRYGHRIALGGNFRVYNDQRKDVLLRSDHPGKSFLGYRFTSDGKSIEFGETGDSSYNQMERSEALVGNESSTLCPQLPSFPANCEPQQPLADPELQPWIPECRLDVDDYSSTPDDLIQVCHQAHGDETSAQSSITTSQKQHPVTRFWTSEDEKTGQCSSTTQEANPPEATMNHNPVHDSSICIQGVSRIESPPPELPLEVHDLDSLLNDPGSPCIIPESFWETEIDDILNEINRN